MSREDLTQVLRGAVEDAGFAAQLATDEALLTGYDLSADERRALLEHDEQALRDMRRGALPRRVAGHPATRLTSSGRAKPMAERERPDLNHVRGALREEDERVSRVSETEAPSRFARDRAGQSLGMSHSLLHETDALRTFAVVLDRGERVCESLFRFATEQEISAASVAGIGAFAHATLGFFDWERKDYDRIPVEEQVEVLSLTGDVALAPDGKPQLHLRVVLGKRDGTAHGGHLLDAEVRPTLELVITETPPDLRRRHDPETGLALIALTG